MLRRQIATEKEEIERLRAEIADIQRWKQTGMNSGCEWVLIARVRVCVCGLNAALCLFSRQQGRSETEEYSSDSESESEDEEELQMILEDLQKQNEELEVRRWLLFPWNKSLVMLCVIFFYFFCWWICWGMQHLNCLLVKYNFFSNLFVLHCVSEQKHPPEPGDPRRTGSHLRAPCPASPPAEPQTAAGNNCPTTIWASPARAAEPRASQRGANQTRRRAGSLRRRRSCLFQRQNGERSFEAFAQQRQERFQHVRWLHRGNSGGSVAAVSASGQVSPSFTLLY